MARKPEQKRSMRIEDLQSFKIPGDVQISPDADRALFTLSTVEDGYRKRSRIGMVGCADRGHPQIFTSGPDDRLGRWHPDGSSIVFISRREEGQDDLYQIPSDGGEAERLTHFPEGSISRFDWSPDGRWLAVAFRAVEPEWSREACQQREETGASTPARVIDSMFYRLDGDGYFNGQRYSLYLVDVSTGEERILFDRDRMGGFDWSWAPDSRELVVTANTSEEPMLATWKVDLFRVSLRTGRSRKITGLPPGPKSAVQWSPDGKRIAWAGRRGREIWGIGNTHLHVLDIASGTVDTLLTESDYCLTAATLSDTAEATFDATLFWARDSGRILTTIGWHGTNHVASVDISTGTVAFHSGGRKVYSMTDYSASTGTAGLLMTSSTSLPEVCIGRFSDPSATDRLSITKRTRFHDEAIRAVELVRPESHWVTSDDGHRVQVWVMRPAGQKPGESCPAILEIHGGPHCQYGEAFFHEFQALAAQGYAVVYSNPRGSKGYGETHCCAIKGDWGNADWCDLQAVTRFMQQQDWIDQNRIGIMGGSYGGYMTNWAISHSDAYRAAITDRCVSNLISMIGSSDLPLIPDEYWSGNGWDDTEALWEQSPLKHFRNVRTPTLVIHSEGDLRCNVEQGEQVFAALKLLKVPTRFIRYPTTTSHGMSRMGPPDLRIHRLDQIVKWWQTYLD